ATTERLIQRTNVGHAPGTMVDGSNERYRSLVVGTRVRDALHRRLGLGDVPRRRKDDSSQPGRADAPAVPSPTASIVDARHSFDLTPGCTRQSRLDNVGPGIAQFGLRIPTRQTVGAPKEGGKNLRSPRSFLAAFFLVALLVAARATAVGAASP